MSTFAGRCLHFDGVVGVGDGKATFYDLDEARRWVCLAVPGYEWLDDVVSSDRSASGQRWSARIARACRLALHEALLCPRIGGNTSTADQTFKEVT